MADPESVDRVARESDRQVRDAVVLADRRRRARDASRRLWRAAPIVAAASLSAAAGSRWAGWPAIFPLTVLGIGCAGLVGYAYFSRRDHVISDAAAAEIDADASLRGELRSANWFAAREARDPWADFHLERAAARLRTTDWAQLYPVAPAHRARLATSAMVIGALALVVVTFPGRPGIPGSASARAAAVGAVSGGTPGGTDMLPPELPAQLEDLLKAAEAGNASAGANALTAAEVQALLAQLATLHDPEALKALAEAMARSRPATDQLAQKMKALAERAQRAAEMSMTKPDVSVALQDLAKQLENAAKSQEAPSGEEPTDAMSSKEPPQGDAGNADAAGDTEDVSVQFSKNAGAGSGIGVLMSSSDAPPTGEVLPGLGVGGASGTKTTGGKMADLERALRQETIEASADSLGDNVLSGARRKTEEGNATVTFTRSASGTFDRGRAAPPPRVPEGRRTGVQTYFLRKQ